MMKSRTCSISEFICESYWSYRKQFPQTRDFFRVPTRIKLGVETFDDRIRNEGAVPWREAAQIGIEMA